MLEWSNLTLPLHFYGFLILQTSNVLSFLHNSVLPLGQSVGSRDYVATQKRSNTCVTNV